MQFLSVLVLSNNDLLLNLCSCLQEVALLQRSVSNAGWESCLTSPVPDLLVVDAKWLETIWRAPSDTLAQALDPPLIVVLTQEERAALPDDIADAFASPLVEHVEPEGLTAGKLSDAIDRLLSRCSSQTDRSPRFSCERAKVPTGSHEPTPRDQLLLTDYLPPILGALLEEVMVVDDEGNAIWSNVLWETFCVTRTKKNWKIQQEVNLLDICNNSCDACAEEAVKVADAFRRTRTERNHETKVVYRCDAGSAEPRWFQMQLSRVSGGSQPMIVVCRRDITSQVRLRERTVESAEATRKLSRLTPREAEVMKQIVSGASNKVVAYRLDVSEKTVEKHRANIMKKLAVTSLPELVRLSVSAGHRNDPHFSN